MNTSTPLELCFVLPIEAFEEIVIWNVDNMPMNYIDGEEGGRGA